MQGVTDAPMRAVQGLAGAFTFAVSEFLRVSQQVPPRSAILRHIPELGSGGRTPTGLPVQVQLLGGHPGRMAATAASACELGAMAIDINFGCPAPTVNRHDGGATLLRHPGRIREIVAAIRGAVPREIPVSAKLRLGWDHTDSIFENASMAAEGGASWLAIHGRTRMAGYAPPAYWGPIGLVRERLGIPVVANGDIWTIADFRRCRDESGCRHFMLGRGALADPRLAPRIAEELGLLPAAGQSRPIDWVNWLQRLVDWSRNLGQDRPGRILNRLKQWLNLAALHGDFRRFETIKRAETVEEILTVLAAPIGRVPSR